ncbi:MAG: large conductance mechanosensitive channel protein MscL [Hyphomicrobiales bacterium]|nr:large conductance mechanosensitive channel protein MscL [Hyphomicrobiales bacterium]MDE2114367.1 large conductance mechanosensitive channel protein MscL [Hyphomicrobiales bacterium]
MLKEFKEFAVKGNAFDLAVGVIIGAAFGKIIDSLVNDIIMPLIGSLTGGLDFTNYFLGLAKAVNSPVLADARKQGAVLAYGNFIQIIINFLIVAFALFLIVRQMNALKKEEAAAPEAPAAPTADQALLTEIRDLLAKR